MPGRFVRNWNINFNQWAGWNFGGDRLFSGGNINTHWTWNNNYSVGHRRQPERRAVPGSRHARRARGARQPVAQRLVLRQHRQAQGAVVQLQRLLRGRRLRHQPPQGINPWVNLAALVGDARSRPGCATSINNDDAQWVANEDDEDGTTHYVFGRIEQRTVAMTLRFNYTMTPNLSLQTYAEPFVSAGDYTNFRELVDGRARRATRIAISPTTTPGTPTSTSARSGPPTSCGGSTSRGRSCSSSGSRAATTSSTTTATSSSTATSAACSRRRRRMCFWSSLRTGGICRDQGSGIRDQGSGIRDQGRRPRIRPWSIACNRPFSIRPISAVRAISGAPAVSPMTPARMAISSSVCSSASLPMATRT